MSAPYRAEMDPEAARLAVEGLSTALLLDVPAGMQFGLDGIVFTVGERFRGVKMIPNGVHYFMTNTGHQDTASAPVSCFHIFPSSQILIRRWNADTEQIECVSEPDQEERLRQGVLNHDFDSGLAPYDMSRWRQWRRLTGWIDQQGIDRLMNGAVVLSIAEEARGIAGLSMRDPAEAALIEQLQQSDSTRAVPQRLNLGPFPVLIKKTGWTPSELSAANLDKTQQLREILQEWYGGAWEQLLGEMQFCFVAFVMGQSFQALEQWKKILHLLLGCFEADPALQGLFRETLKALRYQLDFLIQAEEGVISDVTDPLTSSFLKTDLLEFIRNGSMEDSGFDASVKREVEKLATFVKERLEWDVEQDEDDEYAPVVVV